MMRIPEELVTKEEVVTVAHGNQTSMPVSDSAFDLRSPQRMEQTSNPLATIESHCLPRSDSTYSRVLPRKLSQRKSDLQRCLKFNFVALKTFGKIGTIG